MYYFNNKFIQHSFEDKSGVAFMDTQTLNVLTVPLPLSDLSELMNKPYQANDSESQYILDQIVKARILLATPF